MPTYWARTWELTSHVIHPALPGVVALTAAPVVVGWLFQFTPGSVQVELACRTSIVRGPTGDLLYRRSVAPVTLQPLGTVGRVNSTTARVLELPDLPVTLRTLSPPLLLVGDPWFTQESNVALTVV